MDFPGQINAVLLAGGQLKDLSGQDQQVIGKGHLLIGGIPMAARTWQGLKESPVIGDTVLVSPQSAQQLGPEWSGIKCLAPAGDRLLDSVCSGLSALPESNDPVLLVAGDLPFLTGEAVTDFVRSCRQRPEASLWYGFLRKSTSEAKYPEVSHTWVTLAEGTFCGTGLVVMRPSALEGMKNALKLITGARKNPLKLAQILGWSTLWRLLIRTLTVPMAEEAGRRLLQVQCHGVEAYYAETAYNVDDAESLQAARELCKS